VPAASVFKLSVAQLERLIRGRAAQPMQVRLTVHALARMKLRQVLRDEVLEVLERGRIVGRPEPNLAHGALECRVQQFLAGREIAVVAAVSDDEPTVVVVTVIDVDKR
jgi:Domain of unknown function (DUF4258)